VVHNTAQNSCNNLPSYHGSHDKGLGISPPPHHNRFTALFLGPPGWAGARRELLDFMVQEKTNRGRHTDHPTGRHSIRTNQCHLHHPPIFLQAGLGISPYDTNGDIPLDTKLQLFATPDNCASQGMTTRHNVVNRWLLTCEWIYLRAIHVMTAKPLCLLTVKLLSGPSFVMKPH